MANGSPTVRSLLQEARFTVLVLGLPNVGKSTLINSLRALGIKKGKAAPTGREPGVTRRVSSLRSTIKIYDGDNDTALQPNGSTGNPGVKIHLMDTPGILDPSTTTKDLDQMLKIALVNGVKDSVAGEEVIARYLMQTLQNTNNTRYHQVFQLDSSMDVTDFDVVLNHVARRIGALGKGGILMRARTAKWMLECFRTGKLGPVLLDNVNSLLAMPVSKDIIISDHQS